MSDLRESSRQLAEGVSATLSDEQKAKVQDTAVLIVDDLRKIASGDPAEFVIEVAQSITAMIATLIGTPLGTVGDLMEHNMCAYALATGALAGVYVLPGVEESVPEKLPAPELSDEWTGTGQYL